MKHRSRVRLVCRALLVSSLAAGAVAPANADAVPGMDWTSVGSAGTVDEADVAAVSLDGAVAAHIGAAGRTMRIRYNVVAVDGLSGGNGIALVGNLRDTGPGQVILTLKRYSFDTNLTEPLAELDSDRFASSLNFQTRSTGTCEHSFDFTRYAYFVEAQLVRKAASPPLLSLPALAGVRVSSLWC